MRKPIRRVKFTKAVVRHADIRNQNPSLGLICPGEPHQRDLGAPKFEDRSQEETEWQEQGAREAACRLTKSILKLKEKNKVAFFSPSENWCLLASSNLKPEEGEFVIDSGASMHMISKKDLNFGEMDFLTKSCTPTLVITANGEVQTHEETTVYVKELDIFLTMEVLDNTSAVLSLGKLYDGNGYSFDWINGQKPHLIKKGIRIQCNTENFVPIVVPDVSSSSSSNFPSSTSMTLSRQEIYYPTSSSSTSTSLTTTVSSDSETGEDLSRTDSFPVSVPSEHVERKERWDPFTKPTKNPKPNKNENHETEREDPLCAEIPEWLQEFKENLVDDEIPEHRDSHASSSHEPSLEPTSTRSVDLDKHEVYTRFPQDRMCEICQRTEITRVPCKRRIGGVVPRAENIGDFLTADHKVLSEGCESRNNHRYAVVVQDLTTEWIQSYPCKTKTSQETQRNLQKFLESDRKSRVIYTDNSLEFGKACEDLCWNHSTSTSHRSETNGIAERAVRCCERRHLCRICAIRSEWKLVIRFYGILYLSAKRYRSLIWWENTVWEILWETIQRINYSILFTGWILHHFCYRPVKNPSIWKESLTWIVFWIRFVREGIWKGDVLVADLEELETMDASEIYSQKRIYFPKKMGILLQS